MLKHKINSHFKLPIFFSKNVYKIPENIINELELIENRNNDISYNSFENDNSDKSNKSATGCYAGSCNLTFDHIRSEYQLTDEVLKSASSLETVIDRFETDIARKSLNYDFVLVTNGQHHIRQCLFPEAQRKNIKLPNYYYSFHDLRKEFMAARPNSSVMTIKDMLNGN